MAGSSLHTEGDWLFETLFFRNRCAPSAQPNFCAELGGIVNVKSLIELFGQIPYRGDLYANLWTPPAQGELLAPAVECTNLSGLLWDR
jgi:hypothetical protein